MNYLVGVNLLITALKYDRKYAYCEITVYLSIIKVNVIMRIRPIFKGVLHIHKLRVKIKIKKCMKFTFSGGLEGGCLEAEAPSVVRILIKNN